MQIKKKILIRVLTTLLGWPVAFVIAYFMLLVFGKQLQAVSQAFTAFVISGVIVTIMGNVAMPFIGKKVEEYVEKMYSKRKEVV